MAADNQFAVSARKSAAASSSGITAVLRINDRISIDEADLSEDFIRSSGAGGQNVNKVATAVQLRFSADGVAKLPPLIGEKLLALAGHRRTKAGEVLITAQRFRTQERNRADARDRLSELINNATIRPAFRVATKPTRASKTRRLERKRRQALTKQGRAKADIDG